ncbi:MAG: hypothetical protein HY879_12550 [Deltaproteobacteria bacterium]|nr:hypothetical protein [Deltaproteobacteria bacterium]
MPQTHRRGVAPLDPQPRWPDGYIAVLREAGAQEKTLPYLNLLIYKINFLRQCQSKSVNKENPWFLTATQTSLGIFQMLHIMHLARQ